MELNDEYQRLAKRQSVKSEEQQVQNKAEMELELKRKRRAFDGKLDDIMTTAIQMRQQYGAEDFRYQMMLTFLEVGLQMRDAVEMLTSVQTAMSCISEAIGFMDGTLNAFDVCIDGMMSGKKGLLSEFNRRRKIEKAIKENNKRVQAMTGNIKDMVNMANRITQAFSGSFNVLQNGKKSAKTSQPANSTSRAEAAITTYLKGKGINVEPTPTSSETQTKPDGKPSTGITGWDAD